VPICQISSAVKSGAIYLNLIAIEDSLLFHLVII
jgi:hypothetical protein